MSFESFLIFHVLPLILSWVSSSLITHFPWGTNSLNCHYHFHYFPPLMGLSSIAESNPMSYDFFFLFSKHPSIHISMTDLIFIGVAEEHSVWGMQKGILIILRWFYRWHSKWGQKEKKKRQRKKERRKIFGRWEAISFQCDYHSPFSSIGFISIQLNLSSIILSLSIYLSLSQRHILSLTLSSHLVTHINFIHISIIK